MKRKYNTKKDGSSFSKEVIDAVWRKASPLSSLLGSLVQAKDRCGATIKRVNYGKLTNLGWEIDHILPVSKGGTDSLSNLQPLHWKNNRKKGDDYPNFMCAVKK